MIPGERTPWYPKSTNPVRVGVYEVLIADEDMPIIGTAHAFVFWDGNNWTRATRNVDEYEELTLSLIHRRPYLYHKGWFEFTAWRGLAQEAK